MPGSLAVGSLIVGFYRESKLIHVAKIKNGFVPLTRREIFRKIKESGYRKMPFRKLAGEPQRSMGSGTYCGRYEEVRVGSS